MKIPLTVNRDAKPKSLFIERCLDLLEPGSRLGIVLPEGPSDSPAIGKRIVRDGWVS